MKADKHQLLWDVKHAAGMQLLKNIENVCKEVQMGKATLEEVTSELEHYVARLNDLYPGITNETEALVNTVNEYNYE